jgi:hypothetical protein
VFAKLIAPVPAALLLKLKLNVSHPLATVVLTTVSTLIAGFVLSSTFNLTSIPAIGEYTTALIVVVPDANARFPFDGRLN